VSEIDIKIERGKGICDHHIIKNHDRVLVPAGFIDFKRLVVNTIWITRGQNEKKEKKISCNRNQKEFRKIAHIEIVIDAGSEIIVVPLFYRQAKLRKVSIIGDFRVTYFCNEM
jgi:predicted transcriptional regulator